MDAFFELPSGRLLSLVLRFALPSGILASLRCLRRFLESQHNICRRYLPRSVHFLIRVFCAKKTLTMKQSKLVCLALLVSFCAVDGFTFMKNWKLPSRNKNGKLIQERFGEKRKSVWKLSSAIVVLAPQDFHERNGETYWCPNTS